MVGLKVLNLIRWLCPRSWEGRFCPLYKRMLGYAFLKGNFLHTTCQMYMQLHSQHVKMTIECQIFSWKALGYARVFHDTETIHKIFFLFFSIFLFYFEIWTIQKQHNNKSVKFAHAPKIWLKPASVAMFLQFIIAISYVLYMSPKIMEFEV